MPISALGAEEDFFGAGDFDLELFAFGISPRSCYSRAEQAPPLQSL
jgi:hypothetical protein